MNARLRAILQALFVVFLWATSWVLIKVGLQDLPPLTFAGVRYLIAFLCLLVFLQFTPHMSGVRSLSLRKWLRLIILGVLFYAVTQGASFVALAYLPAVTVNLIWNFSSVTVAVLGMIWLSEIPTSFQWVGILLALLGAGIYFRPAAIPASQTIGIVVSLLGVLTNASSSILGRDVNRSLDIPPLVVTVISMGSGSVLLLGTGLVLEGIPAINPRGWAIILWLAVVNTAFAFSLWNRTLRTLTAIESSIINSTMMIWIPIFAVLFLGESITLKEALGLLLAGAGTLVVQLHRLPGSKLEDS